MKIKYPKDLVEGDVVIHNHEKLKVIKYVQGLGAGSFFWGTYGVLYVKEVVPEALEYERLAKKKDFWTYENYPFIVED